MYSESINNLISAFRKLPSVGQRTAERFVFHILKSGKQDADLIKNALEKILQNTKSCESCWNFDDHSPCRICKNTQRNHAQICVVADPQDMAVLEKIGEFTGVYHILRGVIDPGDEEKTLQKIKIKELLKKIMDKNKPIKEVILALNSDLTGETTMLFLEREIKKLNPQIIITRLARGLPMGSDLQYADKITLMSALKNRIKR